MSEILSTVVEIAYRHQPWLDRVCRAKVPLVLREETVEIGERCGRTSTYERCGLLFLFRLSPMLFSAYQPRADGLDGIVTLPETLLVRRSLSTAWGHIS